MNFKTHSSFVKYVGEWEKGAFEGQGQLFLNNGEEYVGEWKNGLRTGKGMFKYGKGGDLNSYIGIWKEDQYHGEGVLAYKSGASLTAEFKEGEANGMGCLEDNKRKVVSKGLFKNGKFDKEANINLAEVDKFVKAIASKFKAEGFKDYSIPSFDAPAKPKLASKKEAGRDASKKKSKLLNDKMIEEDDFNIPAKRVVDEEEDKAKVKKVLAKADKAKSKEPKGKERSIKKKPLDDSDM